MPRRSEPGRALETAQQQWREEAALAVRSDDLRVRRAFATVIGAGLGVLASAVAIFLFVPFFAMNAISALGLLTGFTVAGIIVARRQLPRKHNLIAATEIATRESWVLQQAEAAYARTRGAIIQMANTLRASGIDEETIKERALAAMDQAFDIYRTAAIGTPAHDPLAPLPARTLPIVDPPPLPAPLSVDLPAPVPSTPPLALSNPPMFPEPLIAAKQQGLLVPFVGAGLSLAKDVKGGFPSWPALPTRLLEQCDAHGVWNNPTERSSLRSLFLEPDPTKPGHERPRSLILEDMLGALDLVKSKLGNDYDNALDAIFRPRDAMPGAAHQVLKALAPQIVLTTNYDQLIEAADGPPRRQVYTWRQSARALGDIKADRPVLFKIHGSAEVERSVILTMNEYTEVQKDSAYLRVMGHLLARHTFLFIGYGMSDPHDLDLILAQTLKDLRSAATHHFALFRRPPDHHDELKLKASLRKDHNIEVLWYAEHADLPPLLEALARA